MAAGDVVRRRARRSSVRPAARSNAAVNKRAWRLRGRLAVQNKVFVMIGGSSAATGAVAGGGYGLGGLARRVRQRRGDGRWIGASFIGSPSWRWQKQNGPGRCRNPGRW